jgi:hypothetical protein
MKLLSIFKIIIPRNNLSSINLIPIKLLPTPKLLIEQFTNSLRIDSVPHRVNINFIQIFQLEEELEYKWTQFCYEFRVTRFADFVDI